MKARKNRTTTFAAEPLNLRRYCLRTCHQRTPTGEVHHTTPLPGTPCPTHLVPNIVAADDFNSPLLLSVFADLAPCEVQAESYKVQNVPTICPAHLVSSIVTADDLNSPNCFECKFHSPQLTPCLRQVTSKSHDNMGHMTVTRQHGLCKSHKILAICYFSPTWCPR